MAADGHDDHRHDQRITRRQALVASAGACAGGAAMLGLLGGEGPSWAVAEQLKRYGRSAVDPSAQNAILIVTDSTRADYVGAYGSKRGLTPNLDALARDGVTFTRAHPESMPTGPARNALLTGDREFPYRHWHPEPFLPKNPGWSSIPPGKPTLLDLLDRNGVTTAYVTDNPFLIGPRYARIRRRTDHFVGFEGQTAIYSARHRDPVPVAQVQRFLPPSLRGGSGAENALALYLAYAPRGVPEDEYFTARVFKAAIDLIETLRAHQPFVLIVDGFDPHEPWDPPPAWARRFAGENPLDYEPLHPFNAPISAMSQLGLSPAVAKRVQGLYAAELAFTDHWIGNLLGKVESAGLTDSTAVVYTSDHGILLGEHGLIGKSGRHIHREVHHTPLIVRHPERKLAGRRNRYFASTNDVAPTLLGFLGIRPGRQMDGEDLTAVFDRARKGEIAPRKHMTASYDDYVMCHDGRWLLFMRTDGFDKNLFDTKTDRGETRNLAAARPDVVRRLTAALKREAGGPLPRFTRTGVR
ncbi:MAG TPA: sulfatase [Conexibacter sp.]|nr:sulfatase [Conexibacter sp.]